MIKSAILGSPVSHSLSPALHMAAYKKLGIDVEYTAIEIKENELVSFIAGLDSSWTGFAVTMPLKEVVLEVASSIDPIAAKITSANTLIRRGKGWFATSTDRTGFRSILHSHKIFSAPKVLILGAGGTARAALSALDSEGRDITVLRRSPHRDSSLVRCLDVAQLKIEPWSAVNLSAFDLVINTVPGSAPAELFSEITTAPVLIDVLYRPWPSPLAEKWLDVQPKVISGIELLIWQGIDQIELMSGASFNREEMFDYLFHTLVKLR